MTKPTQSMQRPLTLDPSAPPLFRLLFVTLQRAPKWLAEPLVATLLAVMRATRCARGKHLRGSNYCIYGCGTLSNKEAFQEWIVTLTSGEQRVVHAINAHHARSLVVYGPAIRIDHRTREPVGPVLVHPSNVVDVRPAHANLVRAEDDEASSN